LDVRGSSAHIVADAPRPQVVWRRAPLSRLPQIKFTRNVRLRPIADINSPCDVGAMIRHCLVLVSVALASCTTVRSPEPDLPNDLQLYLAADTTSGQPRLRVVIENCSAQALCTREEVIRNPYTRGIRLELRDPAGRVLPELNSGGLRPPPLAGTVRLEPGETVEGKYHADAYVMLRGSLIAGLEARVRFRYGVCEDVWGRRVTSAWQRL